MKSLVFSMTICAYLVGSMTAGYAHPKGFAKQSRQYRKQFKREFKKLVKANASLSPVYKRNKRGYGVGGHRFTKLFTAGIAVTSAFTMLSGLIPGVDPNPEGYAVGAPLLAGTTGMSIYSHKQLRGAQYQARIGTVKHAVSRNIGPIGKTLLKELKVNSKNDVKQLNSRIQTLRTQKRRSTTNVSKKEAEIRKATTQMNKARTMMTQLDTLIAAP